MKALTLGNRVVDVAPTEFEVHESLTWIDCPDDCTAGGWEVKDGKLQKLASTIAREAEEQAWEAGADARAVAKVQNNRRRAYQAEADHLHLEEERGEVPVGTWAAKVAEIKERFPK
jgi:hypothetical protein